MGSVVDLLENFLTPSCVIGVLVVLGYALSRVRFFGMSLDLSAVLIVSITLGVFMSLFPNINLGGRQIVLYDDTFSANLKFLSSIGTALFVSVIGISSGYQLAERKSKKAWAFFFIGVVGILANFALMNLVVFLDKGMDREVMYGIFCGAITSTPGLAAVCDNIGTNAPLAVGGYGISYLFGVLGVVLFVQIASRKSENTTSHQTTICESPEEKRTVFSACKDVAVVIVTGCFLGAFTIPYVNLSLGASGGMLLSGLVIGYICARRKRKISKDRLDTIRNIGLISFFIGRGIPAGVELLSCFSVKSVLYGMILTVVPIFLSWGFTNLITRNRGTVLSVVCGNMTSTPAIGVLMHSRKAETDMMAYSMSYIGALITIVVTINFVL